MKKTPIKSLNLIRIPGFYPSFYPMFFPSFTSVEEEPKQVNFDEVDSDEEDMEDRTYFLPKYIRNFNKKIKGEPRFYKLVNYPPIIPSPTALNQPSTLYLN